MPPFFNPSNTRFNYNSVESTKDLGEKIEHLSKQINVIAGLVLTTISVSDEKGLLSKGAILNSLFSSHEPDDAELL